MSAAYVICGVMVGVMAARISSEHPSWALLLIPAAASYVVGLISEYDPPGWIKRSK
jgi:hypothetical protein